MPRALKFLDLVNRDDILALSWVFDKHPEMESKRREGDRILERIVREGQKHLGHRLDKPGPKAKNPATQIEDSVRRMLRTLAAMMDLPEETPRLRILNTFRKINAASYQLCDENLLLTSQEMYFLARSVEDPLRLPQALVNELRVFAEVVEFNEYRQIPSQSELIAGELPGRKELQPVVAAAPGEPEAFSQIIKELDLGLFCWLPAKVGPSCKERPKRGMKKPRKLSRENVLRAAMARMRHVKELLRLVRFAIPYQAALGVIDFVRHSRLHWGLDEGATLTRQVISTVWNAALRQGVYPRSDGPTLEEMDLSPRMFSEGDSYPFTRHLS